MRPEQAKQIIRRKGVLTVEAAAISLRESPTFLSTTEHWKQRFMDSNYEFVNSIYKYSTNYVKGSYILPSVSVDTIDDCCVDDIAELAAKAKTKH